MSAPTLPTLPICTAHSGAVIDAANGYEVIDCGHCGFAHITPLPTDEQLAELYRMEFYASTESAYLDRYRQDLDWWNLVYDDRYDTFEAHLPPTARRALDVGSGPGYFVLRGKERGWDVLGIEPSEQGAAHTRRLGAAVVQDFFGPEVAGTLGQFDVIHMSLVLEHLPDPAATVRLCGDLLRPGGILSITVPNEYNPLQAVAHREICPPAPWWLCPPHHINYFNSRSLEALVKRCGLEVMFGESTFPMELFLLMGDNYAGDDAIGRTVHRKRMRLEHSLKSAGLSALKRSLYQHMHTLGIGREATVYARRTT